MRLLDDNRLIIRCARVVDNGCQNSPPRARCKLGTSAGSVHVDGQHTYRASGPPRAPCVAANCAARKDAALLLPPPSVHLLCSRYRLEVHD